MAQEWTWRKRTKDTFLASSSTLSFIVRDFGLPATDQEDGQQRESAREEVEGKVNEHYLKGWKQECAVVVVGTGTGEGDIHLCVTYEQICETDPAFLEPESPLVLCGMPAAILRQRRKQLSYSHVMLRRRNVNRREV